MPRDIAQALQRYRIGALPNATTRIEVLMGHALALAELDAIYNGHVGRFRPDYLLPVQPRIPVATIIECDGPVHRTPRQQVKDRRKDAAYRAVGYRVFRFDDRAIRRSAIACVHQVLAAFQETHSAP